MASWTQLLLLASLTKLSQCEVNKYDGVYEEVPPGYRGPSLPSCSVETLVDPAEFSDDFLSFLSSSDWASFVPAFTKYVGFGGRNAAGEPVTK